MSDRRGRKNRKTGFWAAIIVAVMSVVTVLFGPEVFLELLPVNYESTCEFVGQFIGDEFKALAGQLKEVKKDVPEDKGTDDEPRLVEVKISDFPDYSGKDVLEINGNVPYFTDEEIKELSGEYFSPLDSLGRCGAVWARIDRSMMPTEERGQIGQVRPSGWHTVKYPDLIADNYLYNRCHLIAYGLTGHNADPENLITGTRYMNSETMYEYEVMVMKYLDKSDNHVLYRVTPYFRGDELVARGVEMEAVSLEDKGKSLQFHVFVYNVQPGIEIDYATGESRVSK